MTAINTNIERNGPSFVSALWISGVALRAFMALLLFGLMYLQPISLALLAAIIGLDLGVYLFQLLRYSTAAGVHLTETGRFWSVVTGGAFFLFAAALMFAQWAILFTGSDAKKMNFLPTEEASTAEPTRFNIRLSPDRRSLTFSGVMAQGMISEIEKVTNRAPDLQAMIINSPGGDLYEARELARLIERKGLSTHVTKECSASCLLGFMAGKERSLGPGAQLGWHRYGLDFTQLLSFVSPSAELPKDRQFYLSRGVATSFLDKALAEERRAMWYPTRSEMRDAGVLTRR